ncbi:MAG: hypothetical protein ACREOO_20880 [bacterium]
MSSTKSLAKSETTTGWSELLINAVKVAVVGFVVLQAKEYFEAGMLDTPATALDAGLIAAGVFVLNAILKLVKS